MLGGFAASQGLMYLFGMPALHDQLVLDGIGVRAEEYWRFATYQLLQAGLVQFFATALILYFAGREVEPIIGRGHVLGMFFGANLLGGAVSWWMEPASGIYGASAGTAALLTAYAIILPELEHRTRLFWLFPIRFHTRHAVILMLALAGWWTLAHLCSRIGPAGILTGALLGWLWARALGFGRVMWFHRAATEREAIERRRERMSADEFINAEIDPILEKISRTGMRSLSREERRLLECAREKIASKRTTR